jgi:hypothetical protein
LGKRITENTPVAEVIETGVSTGKYTALSNTAARIAQISMRRLQEKLDENHNLQPTALAGIADKAVTIVTKLEALQRGAESERVSSSADIAERAKMLRAAAEELLKRGDGE